MGTAPDAGPPVVHCSAGVGRSGTFICMDICFEILLAGQDPVVVMNIIAGLRQNRNFMVQAVDQLRFIYQTLPVMASSLLQRVQSSTSTADDSAFKSRALFDPASPPARGPGSQGSGRRGLVSGPGSVPIPGRSSASNPFGGPSPFDGRMPTAATLPRGSARSAGGQPRGSQATAASQPRRRSGQNTRAARQPQVQSKPEDSALDEQDQLQLAMALSLSESGNHVACCAMLS